jgi:hypothetical protein
VALPVLGQAEPARLRLGDRNKSSKCRCGHSQTAVEVRFDAIVIFGLAPNSSTVTIIEMANIISRNNRCYVVAYDGVDPATGRERRRWRAAGSSRADAEAIASSITETNRVPIPRGREAVTLGDYLTNTWLPERRRRVRSTTAYRYGG